MEASKSTSYAIKVVVEAGKDGDSGAKKAEAGKDGQHCNMTEVRNANERVVFRLRKGLEQRPIGFGDWQEGLWFRGQLRIEERGLGTISGSLERRCARYPLMKVRNFCSARLLERTRNLQRATDLTG